MLLPQLNFMMFEHSNLPIKTGESNDFDSGSRVQCNANLPFYTPSRMVIAHRMRIFGQLHSTRNARTSHAIV